MKHIPQIIKQTTRELRNNSTKAEIILWNHMKQEKLGIRFLRQKPVYVFTEDNGLDRFIIVDFYCAEKKCIIELDGGIHNNKEVYDLDREKEELLQNKGIKVMRFSNLEVEKSPKKVIQKIQEYLLGGELNLLFSKREYPRNEGEGLVRCSWANPQNELYIKYHDEEWGVAVYDDKILFEFLILEGAQAGLSWETVLKKRENYRNAFDGFDYEKIAKYGENKIQELLGNEGIIRNKLKINSAIKNAQAFIKIREEFGSFSSYLWGFVNHKQIVNTPKTHKEVSSSTKLSDTISKDLKKHGMNFVGSTIIYAYLQAVGVVDDHSIDCFCKK